MAKKKNEVAQQAVPTITVGHTPIEIALGIDEQGRTTARKLYAFLELAKGQFSRWARTNIVDNDFAEEGVDYWGFDINVEGNKTVDYTLDAAFAKKLAMTSNTEKGELAREYFIKVEERLKEVAVAMQGESAQTAQEALLKEIRDFMKELVVANKESISTGTKTMLPDGAKTQKQTGTGGLKKTMDVDLDKIVNLTLEEAKTRYSIGEGNLIAIADEAGAIIRIGRKKLYSRKVLDEYFDSLTR